MKVRSTIPLPFSADRAGVHLAIIEIFQITQRNTDKSYSLVAIDYTINDHITIAIRNSMPESMRLQYIDSPEEERLKKTTLKVTRSTIIKERTFFFMDTSGLTGSDLEDKLLQDVLLYSCMTDTVYSSGYEDWGVL
jgi:hypothetical protein